MIIIMFIAGEPTHPSSPPYLLSAFVLQSIGFLTALEKLDLTNNTIHSIPAAVGWVNLRSLSVLKLRNTSIPTATFPPLDSCVNLQFLDLSYNAFSGPVPPATIHGFYSGGKMERFDISHNLLSGVLPSEICSFPLMLGCHLEANHFENKTACAGRCGI
jgi:hypothetical protein